MKGIVTWMAQHGVAANLLMVLLVVAGVASLLTIEQQVFPEFSLETVQVQVPYPGASPEEVEQGIIERIEERIGTVEGIDELRAVASEGLGVVVADLKLGVDEQLALDRIKSEVDRITTFPEDAEEPEVRLLSNRRRVLQVVVYGEASERALKETAYRIEDELTARPDVTDVQVSGVRTYEVSIEVPKSALRTYGLSLPQIAGVVRQSSLDLPAGTIETDSEEITVRTEGQNYTAEDYQDIVIRGTPSGATIRLGDIAEIEDDFADRSDLIARFNGQRAAFVDVYRAEGEQVLNVVESVQQYIDEDLTLPDGAEVLVWRNEAESLNSRLNLLVENGIIGLILVILALTLFLNPRLAFWVAAGIFISFIATFAAMRYFEITINQLSLFGFILAIGIVVDDAIVVGENVYAERERGKTGLDASIVGTRRVMVPVIFAVLTTIVAFVPLLFVPGTTGKITKPIPQVVILVLLFSLIESLLILPHHLSKSKLGETESNRVFRFLNKIQGKVDKQLKRFVNGPLDTFIRFCTRHYGVTIAVGAAMLLIVFGLVRSGYIRFQFLPSIEGDYVTASLEMPVGTSAERTQEVAEFLRERGRAAADSIEQTLPDEAPTLVRNVRTSVGLQPTAGSGPRGSGVTLIRSNAAEITFQLADAADRSTPASAFEQAWRDAAGSLPEARALTFSAEIVNLGSPINVELSAADPEALEQGVRLFKEELRQFGGVFDVRDDRGIGKQEIELTLKPYARTLGLTLEDLATQVRAAFFGAEALRVQRGREEVRVYVRLPDDERDQLADVNDYRIRTPDGGAVPLEQVAEVMFSMGPATITRDSGRRVVSVTADTDPAVVTGQQVIADLRSDVLPRLQREVNGLEYTFGGQQERQQESLNAIFRNIFLAFFAIYALLAIPLRSYLQPIVIMSAIPFGFIGAALGHLMLGLPLGILSLYGIVGLSGVVVNDSLVMVDFINDERLQGKSMFESIVTGARNRFRPIMLTSLTTFLGVFPLIIEQSVQAQFLIPMAVSLGFGIVFATFVLMGMVPALTKLQYDATVWYQTRLRGTPADEVELVHASQHSVSDDGDEEQAEDKRTTATA